MVSLAHPVIRYDDTPSWLRPVQSGYGVRLYGGTSGYAGLKPAAAAGVTDYTLPSAAPLADGGELLGSAAGVMSWRRNYSGASAPTVLDDSADGYSVGSRWYDTLSGKEYVCLNAALGAADWPETTAQGVTAHGSLTGLTGTDHHTQYALLAGRAGGQVITGGTGTTDDLTLKVTSGIGATGADMHFLVGNNGATEAMTILNSGNVGIGTSVPLSMLHVNKSLTHTYPTPGIVNGSVHISPGSNVNGDSSSITFGAIYEGFPVYPTYAVAGIYVQSSVAYGSKMYFGTTESYTTGSQSRMMIDQSGNVGIGQTTPTAVLHLKAGTATASTAPLKFTSGTLLTTAEAGAVEFLSDAYYGTITTGAARKTFAFLESPAFTGQPSVVSTTAPQFSVKYDANNRLDLSVGSTGGVTFDAVGAGAGFTFNDLVTIPGGSLTLLGSAGFSCPNGYLQIMEYNGTSAFSLFPLAAGSVIQIVGKKLTWGVNYYTPRVGLFDRDAAVLCLTDGSTGSGHFEPQVTNTGDLGSATYAWRSLYLGTSLVLSDGGDILIGNTAGTQIGTASTDKIAFLGAVPSVQRAHVADPSGGLVTDAEARTAINAILVTLETFGFHTAA